ncbi:hypothetical protein LYNGBM3L_02180 [Moorena producens 3L]|uniref:Uncharacterized protein n=1 Tax=Moorena producens 3L TaxID=489825 RepID=F4XRK5_9CYAN|nr:hypothetical protein LYNGBM3L_02180 [Moorena producens 3L]
MWGVGSVGGVGRVGSVGGVGRVGSVGGEKRSREQKDVLIFTSTAIRNWSWQQ